MQSSSRISFPVLLATVIAAPALLAAENDGSLAVAVEKTRTAMASIAVTTATGKNKQFSGFAVGEDGKIVTFSATALENAERVSVTLADGRTFDATTVNSGGKTHIPFGQGTMILTRPPGGDTLKRGLALISINAKKLPAVEIGDGRSARVGDEILVVGIDAEHHPIAAKGLITAEPHNERGFAFLGIIATSYGFLDGAPVLNAKGQVIGLATIGTSTETVGTRKETKPSIFVIPLKLSDAYQFRLGNVGEFDRGKAKAWDEELDELHGDKEFVRRYRERVRAHTGAEPEENAVHHGFGDEALTSEDWDWLAERHPRNSMVWVRKALALCPDRRVDQAKPEALAKALPLLRKAVTVNPDNAHAWKEIVYAATGLKRPVEKLEALRAIARISPRDAGKWDDLGSEFADQGKTGEAESAYRQGLELSNDAREKTVSDAWTELCWNFAGLLTRASRSDEALAVVELTVRLREDCGIKQHFPMTPKGGREAVDLALEGKTDEADGKFRAILADQPSDDDHFAYYNLGVLQFQAKDYARAVVAFDSAYAAAKPHDEYITKLAALGWCVAKSKLGESGAAKERLARELAQ